MCSMNNNIIIYVHSMYKPYHATIAMMTMASIDYTYIIMCVLSYVGYFGD